MKPETLGIVGLLIVWFIGVLLSLALTAGIIWVLWHFISKFW